MYASSNTIETGALVKLLENEGYTGPRFNHMWRLLQMLIAAWEKAARNKAEWEKK